MVGGEEMARAVPASLRFSILLHENRILVYFVLRCLPVNGCKDVKVVIVGEGLASVERCHFSVFSVNFSCFIVAYRCCGMGMCYGRVLLNFSSDVSVLISAVYFHQLSTELFQDAQIHYEVLHHEGRKLSVK